MSNLKFTNGEDFICPRCGKPTIDAYKIGVNDIYDVWGIRCTNEECDFESSIHGDSVEECKHKYIHRYYMCDLCGFSDCRPTQVEVRGTKYVLCDTCMKEAYKAYENKLKSGGAQNE